MGDSRNLIESTANVSIRKVLGSVVSVERDVLAVEEPLEIRISYYFKGQPQTKSLSVTMRTPGHDAELAAGFLAGEGIVRRSTDISAIRFLGSGESNEVQVELDPSVDVDLARLERHFYTTSSCGVCGKTSLDAVEAQGAPEIPVEGMQISASTLHSLPARARQAQPVFVQTGGLHAAALFDEAGELVSIREDVGRHNALDKLIGEQLLAGEPLLGRRVLLLSGRASFELIQKAVMAGIPIVAAVGAPSSLAVDLAQRAQITLLGFVRDNQFNIYSGHWRILP